MLQCLQACNLPKQREQHLELLGGLQGSTLVYSYSCSRPHACIISEVWKCKAKGLRHQVVRVALCGFQLSVLCSLGRVFYHMSYGGSLSMEQGQQILSYKGLLCSLNSAHFVPSMTCVLGTLVLVSLFLIWSSCLRQLRLKVKHSLTH